MTAAINALRDKTHRHLGSSSPTPEDHSIRQEVGTFRQHTNNEVKRINKELGELKEHNLKLHHLQCEQMRQKAAADAAAAAAPPPPPPPPPPPAIPILAASTSAQVLRKGRKKASILVAKPPPAEAVPTPTLKAPATPKKGLTMRERRRMIKRD